MTLALFGPPGSGKSMLLRRVAEIAERHGGASTNASGHTARPATVVAAVDLGSGGDPAATLAHGLLAALAPDHAGFAEDALQAGGNPHEAAKRAGERSIALRRALDGERKILDDFGARRAKLVETVLFDTGGTRVDAFARANRARIDARLRAFGLPAADPLRTYKDLVRQTAEPGSGSRIGFVLRSLWGYKGQGSLITLALLLFVVAWFAGVGAGDEGRLSGWLAGLGDRFAFVTDWERAHLDWLQPISQTCWGLGALALATLLVRAVRFAGPVLRGDALLRTDLAERRRDVDGLIAQQTRRIDGLAAEADAAARNAEQAERRLGGKSGGLTDHGAALAADLFGTARPPAVAAQAFCAALSRAMAGGGGPIGAAAPGRIVVIVDGLDDLPAPAAATALESLHRLLAQPGFATMIAADPQRLVDALGATDPAQASARLDRAVQLSYDIGLDVPDPGRFADLLVDPRTAEPPTGPADAGRSTIDRPLQPFEADLLRELAPFAGATPRAIKRFVNAYRLARTDARVENASPAVMGCVAWALALDGTPAGADLAGFQAEAERGRAHLDKGSALGRAFSAVHTTVGGDFTAGDARQGLQVARSYRRSGWTS